MKAGGGKDVVHLVVLLFKRPLSRLLPQFDQKLYPDLYFGSVSFYYLTFAWCLVLMLSIISIEKIRAVMFGKLENRIGLWVESLWKHVVSTYCK